jgi:hypothetical protein
MNYSRQVGSDILAVVSASSSIAAWQEQLDWALKIIASLLAISAGIYSIVYRLRTRKKKVIL